VRSVGTTSSLALARHAANGRLDLIRADCHLCPAAEAATMSRGGAAMTTVPYTPPDAVVVSDEDRGRLLDLARAAVAVASGAAGESVLEAAITAGPLPSFPAAAFVTLLDDGELRGCMGTLDPDGEAWQAVVDTAGWAARRDPRFPPLRAAELAALEVDVSILGPMVLLEDPTLFRPGIDGIVISRDGRRGLLLPEVADDVGHGPTDMLDAVCHKAGLPRDAWRHPRSSLWVFRTLRFGGPAA
jgi:AmmeMemoRadiSam system protein A